MIATLAVVTTFAALVGTAAPVVAQRPADSVSDILAEIYGPIDHAPTDVVRGYVVEHREATLVLRGEDGHLFTVNTAGLDAGAMARLEEGRLVMVAVKTGSVSAMPIAAAVEGIEIVPSASIGGRMLDRVSGRVDRVDPGLLALTTDSGLALTVETTRVAEPVSVRAGDLVTIIGTMRAGENEHFVADQIRIGAPATRTPPTDSDR